MRKYIVGIAGLALMTCFTKGTAQNRLKNDTTMNRTVVVEQEYRPVIEEAEKMNFAPGKAELAKAQPEKVPYLLGEIDATNVTHGTMDAYEPDESEKEVSPGYIRAGYGSYNNLDLFAHYLFNLSDADKLNLGLSVDGMNGNLSVPWSQNKDEHDWKAWLYNTTFNADYTHKFEGVDLNVAADYRLIRFNRWQNPFGNQRFTSAGLRAGVNSTEKDLYFQYRAETGLQVYNRHWLGDSDTRETLIHTNGAVSAPISEDQQISLELDMYNLFYHNNHPVTSGLVNDVLKNRTVIDLNPHYEYADDHFLIHLGAHADFSSGGGKKVRYAPDVMAQYRFSDHWALYAKAEGGRLLNDFHRLETLNPYAEITGVLTDTYEAVNAGMGLKATPFGGLWIHLSAGYQSLKDDVYSLLNMQHDTHTCYASFGQVNDRNFYAGIELGYDYRDLFSISTLTTLRNWHYDRHDLEARGIEYFNPVSLMKANVEVTLAATFRPISDLLLQIDYKFAKRPNGEESVTHYILPDISDLGASATYHFYKGVSFYVKTHNLFNRNQQNYFLYPVEKANFVGGLSFQF